PFSAVTFDGSISPDTDKGLSVNASGTINLANGSRIITSGSGGISLTSARDIYVGAGNPSIQTDSGAISLSANYGTSTAGNFVGITLNSAILTTTGGPVALSGTGGTTGDRQVGVLMTNRASISST